MLRIHSSDRLVVLADDLARLLRTVPPDPMTPEWIAAPSKAMQRWLALHLARRLGTSQPHGRGDGVAANIEMSFPGSLMAHVVGADLPDDNPWEVERLAWSTLSVIDRCVDDPLLGSLAHPGLGSRFARARRIADLFDRYDLHRPAMIRRWADGSDTNSAGQPLADHQSWQPHLWRLVRSHIGEPSPAERTPDIISRLESGQLRLDLPHRLIMFGLSVVPGGPGFMDVAMAVGTHHDLHLFLVQPSPSAAEAIRSATRSGSDHLLDDANDHPLLWSWGRPALDTSRVLAQAELRLKIDLSPGQPEPGPSPDPISPPTMLTGLQAAIRSNISPVDNNPVDNSPFDNTADATPDGSVRIHACYGPTRQVEALRDSLLGLMASDPTLNEDDIIVLTPSLERFAPLVEAVFGPSDNFGTSSDHTSLRYRIADRSIRSSNPVLSATTQLLAMATGRFEATTVLDFMALAPVRARFDFTTDDLATIAAWTETTNVRWGLDPEHRHAHGLPTTIDTNTWQSAIDRLLVGSTITTDRPALSIGDVAPEGIEGSLTDLAGRLASVIHLMSRLAAETRSRKPIDEWITLLLRTCGGLLRPPPAQQWQFENLETIVADISDTARSKPGNSATLLTFDDFRKAVSSRMDGRSGRPDFFRGGITVSSLRPLRWLPHRVICVLGLDQSSFGRTSIDGDDLMAAAPMLGDFDQRGENRQALLEAVLSADDHLLIFRDGHDIRTNVEIPRATVVDEFIDSLAAMVDPQYRSEFRESIELRHPRQPFDYRYFAAGSRGSEALVGFDPDSYRGAVARRARSVDVSEADHTDESTRSATTNAGPDAIIELAEAQKFLKNPAKYFTGRVLQMAMPRPTEEIPSILPINPSGLARWGLGQMMLDVALDRELDPSQQKLWSIDELLDHANMVERRTGSIPPAGLGNSYEDLVRSIAGEVIEAAVSTGVRSQPAIGHGVDITLGNQTRIVGVVRVALGEDSPGPAQVRFSTWKPWHLVAGWLDLMCLVADQPETEWRGVTINPVRSDEPRGAEVWQLTPIGRSPEQRLETALRALDVVADTMLRGTKDPIPLFPVVSLKLYLRNHPESQLAGPGAKGRKVDLARSWHDSYHARGDRADPAVGLLYGDIDIDDLLDIEARTDDPPGAGGHVDRWADHLWGAIDESIQILEPGDDQ